MGVDHLQVELEGGQLVLQLGGGAWGLVAAASHLASQRGKGVSAGGGGHAVWKHCDCMDNELLILLILGHRNIGIIVIQRAS